MSLSSLSSEPLLVLASSDATAQRLAGELRIIAERQGRDVSNAGISLQEARQALQSHRDAKVCIVYTSPERFIAHVLYTSGDTHATLHEAASQWRDDAQSILNIVRQNRSRCALFEASHLKRYSQTALDRLGLARTKSEARQFDQVSVSESSDQNAATLNLIAKAHLQNERDLGDLVDELAASTLSLSNEDIHTRVLPVETALESVRNAQSDSQAQKTQLADVQERLTWLEQALEDSEAEVAKHLVEQEAIRTELAETERKNELLDQFNSVVLHERQLIEKEKADLALRVDELARKNQQMALTHAEQLQTKDRQIGAKDEQLAANSQLLEAKYREITQLHQDRADHVRSLENEIGRIMESRSMRLTKPLRWLGRVLRRKSDE